MISSFISDKTVILLFCIAKIWEWYTSQILPLKKTYFEIDVLLSSSLFQKRYVPFLGIISWYHFVPLRSTCNFSWFINSAQTWLTLREGRCVGIKPTLISARIFEDALLLLKLYQLVYFSRRQSKARSILSPLFVCSVYASNKLKD